MENSKRNWWRLLRDGLVASVFFGPVLAIWQAVDDLLSVNAGLALLALICGLLSFCALLDARGRNTLLKWGVSALFSVIWLKLLSEFPVRWVNFQDPGYGRLSGGGWLALTIEGSVLLIARVIAAALAMTISSAGKEEKIGKVRRALQGIVLPALAAIIVGALLYMNAIMPTWDEIYWSTYG